jgi:hypothetical protein
VKRQRDCARCGAGVGRRGREYCCACWRKVTAAAAKDACPKCGKLGILQPGTGACKVCSRACTSCGHPVRRKDAVLCQSCKQQEQRRAAQRPCSRCGRPGYLRDDTGWCGSCSHPGPPPQPQPLRPCAGCGQVRRLYALGLCNPCYQRHPGRPAITAASLAARLEDPPGWLGEFAAHAAAGYAPARAVAVIAGLGRLLADSSSRHPQALLERSGQPGQRPGALARVLEDFFTARGLALPSGGGAEQAAARRQRYIDAVPGPLRPAAAAFARACLQARQRARRARTRPRADDTIERRLSIVRDMAIFLTAERGKRDWATADVHDVEAFLATRPAGRPKHLTALRHFFTWAKASKLVLTDPTRGLSARQPRGYHGPTATLALQQRLFRRWTAAGGVHPHEALTGLLTLIHGASNAELRALTVDGIDRGTRRARLGRRPQPVPLDPATWAALERCLAYHQQLRTSNPHLLVTRKTRATRGPASEDYARNLLRPAGVTPRLLRCTRLASLTASTDPKLASAAFGIHPQAATHYLAGHVDYDRLHGTDAHGH